MSTKLSWIFLSLLFGVKAMAFGDIRLVVGTYTDGGSHGIYSFSLNEETGASKLLDSLQLKNPSYLVPFREGRCLLAVSEMSDSTASLNAIRFDRTTGHMVLINSQPTGGEDPCYVATNGKTALTANYTGGSLSVFPILRDGSLGSRPQLFHGHTGGPDLKRQSSAHIHCARFLGKAEVLATDFSADAILRFRYAAGQLTPLGVAGRLDSGSAPRHLAFSRDGRTVYAMSEIAGTVTVFRNEGGALKKIQVIASDTVGGEGGADIHLSPDGRFLYSSNRLKADGIAVFKVHAQSGKLEKVGYQYTGLHPRNFNITPNGRLMLVACRDSNVIQVYQIDPRSGMLTDLHKDIHLSKPVCVKFVRHF